jgi:hypothetical protein
MKMLPARRVYYNPRGGAFTLAAHTLHVYVYPGPMASPT